MTEKTFIVPNIGCDGCVKAIKNELGDLAGVEMVEGDVATKRVTVRYGDPATWDQIEQVLAEIDYAPAEVEGS
jgi:copper chaperone CopZ